MKLIYYYYKGDTYGIYYFEKQTHWRKNRQKRNY